MQVKQLNLSTNKTAYLLYFPFTLTLFEGDTFESGTLTILCSLVSTWSIINTQLSSPFPFVVLVVSMAITPCFPDLCNPVVSSGWTLLDLSVVVVSLIPSSYTFLCHLCCIYSSNLIPSVILCLALLWYWTAFYKC